MAFLQSSMVLRRNNVIGRNFLKLRFLQTSVSLSQDKDPNLASGNTMTSIPYRGDYSQQGADARRRWVEGVTKTCLHNLDGWWAPNAKFDEEHLIANTENAIGVARIPIGVVGPIEIHGKYANGTFLVPAATTEGALLASACRGGTVLSQSGGVQAHAFRQRIIRAPSFLCESPEQAERLGNWIHDCVPNLHNIVRSVSKRAKLKKVDFFIDAERLNLFFAYDSAEAAGQNMSSTCTKACCEWIMDHIEEGAPDVKVNRIIAENTLSGDKQISSLNALFGRGVSVIAKASIPESIVRSVFKLSSNEIERGFEIYRDIQYRAGSPSVHCGNVPNMVAAMFAALGQDLGSVGECSQAFLNVKKGKGTGGGLDVELNMPSLAIGTVGGGTALPTQTQCLAMVGCAGGEPNSSRKLAEIIASVCLGADLSLLASFVSDSHSDSHDKLGRNRPL